MKRFEEREQFVRTARLIGSDGVRRLASKKVAVFGIGGVGGYVVEALVRTGIGELLLVDADCVSESNINRQIIADYTTIGMPKTEAMKRRIASICPDICVETREEFYLPAVRESYALGEYDYIVDAVDTVTAKVDLIVKAKECGVPIISCMGAGNKLDPTKFVVTDIYKTSICPLARVMRRELKQRGIESCKVVYSTEPAREPLISADEDEGRKVAPGSIAFVPSVAGLIAAAEVVRDLLSAE